MLTMNTNLAAIMVRANLNTSTLNLNQAIERMTTGYKINHAKDNAANYSINTKLSSYLSSYSTAMDNVMLGSTLVDTASSNLSLITSHLQRMRDLSEQAANGTYGTESIEAIQSEIDARTEEIQRVISNTEYNGINLFGSREPTAVTVEESKRVVNQSSFQSGETYYITSTDDLVKLQTLVNSGCDTAGAVFELAGDLNMQGVNFRGIGDSVTAFKGEFRGNNHVISNLTINTADGHAGLFGYVEGGSIDSLGLKNCDITGLNNTGGLAGELDGGTISSCYVTGKVSGSELVGGLVGEVDSAGSINLSYSAATVSGGSFTGGLVGEMAERGKITSSYSVGNVTGSGSYIGGLAGDSSGTITSSYAAGNVTGGDYTGGLVGQMFAGTITSSYASGRVFGGEMIGGLAGLVIEGSITSSYASGNVEGTNFVGGLAGQMDDFDAEITSSYALGKVVGTEKVGGLVGWMYDGFVTSSYAAGRVTGDKDVGGLIGDLSGTITSGYFNEETSGQTAGVGVNNGSGSANGVTTAELNDLIRYGTLSEYDYEKTYGGGGGTGGGTGGAGLASGVITLQVGIDSDDNSKLTIDTSFSFQLNINVTSQASALNALGAIDEALKSINTKQTELGAAQNRLESITESLSINIENLTSSQSTIRDADIAEESSQYIKMQILQQASATLLATANQTPGIALRLL